jgi:sodium transport system permease protein
MSDGGAHSLEQNTRSVVRGGQFGRLGRLVLKELREILRDRRTIITLIVMPLLIYPLLAIVFQRFLMTSLSATQDVSYVIGVDSPIGRQLLERQLQAGDAVLAKRSEKSSGAIDKPAKDDSAAGHRPPPRILPPIAEELQPKLFVEELPDGNLERLVADSTLHLGLVHRRERIDEDKKGLQTPLVWELIYRAGSPPSEAALHFVESRLQAANEVGLDAQLKEGNVSASLVAATERHPISFGGAPPFSLAALIPLILVLMTVTGAVYPAIDLTAGERERGTLETLIAAPVPRLGLLFAKYIAVLTVAIITAVVNLIGMTITAHSTGLAATLFGGEMSLGVVIKVLLLLALFAAFFSAILLAITSYARSFKEAQAYIIPLMLLCLVPGVLCLLPSLEFSGWMAVTPLVNIVMLARDVLEGGVKPGLAIPAVFSTLCYIAAAIALAARIFGTDAILYGSPATWSDLMRRPDESRPAASLAAAAFCLALMFPLVFVSSSAVSRTSDFPIRQMFELRALITAAVFGGVPLLVMLATRVRWKSGLALYWPGVVALVGAAILGASLWPAAHEIALFGSGLQISDELLKRFEGLVTQFQSLPLPFILLTVAIVPAVFEELCFRGFVFSALRQRMSGLWAVVASAVLFGCFHEVLSPGRLLSTTTLGVVLGLVRLRSGSIFATMLLHAVHNGVVLAIVHYRDALAARGFAANENLHLPLKWHALAVVGIIVGSMLIWFGSSRGHQSTESLSTG